MKNKPPALTSLIRLLPVVFAVPLTLYIGYRIGGGHYYVLSFIVLIWAMLPFFLMFEKRGPRANELVTLAVMCAVAVVSRAAFIWLPHFKPITAVIIITGAAFGAEAGFMAGAVSMLVSNFLFGQGMWTPWQMFAFGVAGFLAGAVFCDAHVKVGKWGLALFGGFTVMLIVGPLLDTCTLFTMTSEISAQAAAGVYLAGLPVNAIHASATVLTLLFVSEPLLEKLNRVKTKYGMMERGGSDDF